MACTRSITSTPSPLVQLDVIGIPDFTHGKRPLPVNILRDDGQSTPAKAGPEESAGSFETHVKGRLTVTGDGNDNPYDEIETHYLLESVLGGTAYNNGPASALTTTAVTSGDPSISVSSNTSYTNGGAVLVDVSSDGSEIIARENIDKPDSAKLTVDRAGWSGSTTGGTVYTAMSYFLDPSVKTQTHYYILEDKDSGGSSTKLEHFGCATATCTLTIPSDGGLLTQAWGTRGTSWDDGGSAGTYSADGGSRICAVNGEFFWDGATNYHASDIVIEMTADLQPRATYEGANGFLGYIVTTTAQGSATVDMAMQVGTSPGSALYWRAPAARVNGDLTDWNGMEVIEWEADCTADTDGFGPFRLHIF